MVEYAITSLVSIIYSLGLLISFYFARKIVLSQKAFHVYLVDLVFFFSSYKVFAYYFMPAIMRIFSDFQFVRKDAIDLIMIAKVYMIELFSWLVWLLVLISIAALRKNKISNNKYFLRFKDYEYSANNSKTLLSLLVSAYITYSLLKSGVILNAEYKSYIYLFEPFKSLLSYCGPASAILLTVISLKYKGKWHFLLGLLGTILSLSIVDTRGALVYSLLFTIFISLVLAYSKKNMIIGASILLLLITTYLSLGGLPQLSISVSDTGTVSFDLFINDRKKGSKTAVQEIEWRFGASNRMSTAFVTMYERGDSAGINPIWNSLIGFVPRSLDPNKPFPSTVDGNDRFSQGMYLIYKEIHGDNTSNMVEFSTGGHAYWEFGVLGVIFLSAISSIYVSFCMALFHKYGLVSIPLMLGTFKPWGYVETKMWVSDIIMQIYQLIIPILVINFIYFSIKIFIKRMELLKNTSHAIS